jgi:hypothetical protein
MRRRRPRSPCPRRYRSPSVSLSARSLPRRIAPAMTGSRRRANRSGRPAAPTITTSVPLISASAPPIPTPDPATPLRLKGGGTHLGYQTHYAVDGGKRRIILGVLVAPGEVMENQPMLDLAWHVRFRFHVRPHQATGDTTYGTLENITALERQGIHAYMPLPDWEH